VLLQTFERLAQDLRPPRNLEGVAEQAKPENDAMQIASEGRWNWRSRSW